MYVNYGRVEDFERLANEGVSCNGSIAIARYGKIFRGNKVSTALFLQSLHQRKGLSTNQSSVEDPCCALFRRSYLAIEKGIYDLFLMIKRFEV